MTLTQRAFAEATARDNFVNQVRMVSGRSEASALRLERRIRALAVRAAMSGNADIVYHAKRIRKTWLRRYCEGWSYRFNRVRTLAGDELKAVLIGQA